MALLAKPIPDEHAIEDVHGLVAPDQPAQITVEQVELAIRLLYPECVFQPDIFIFWDRSSCSLPLGAGTY